MRTLKLYLPFLFVAAVSTVLIYVFFPRVHPYGGIKLPLDAKAIVARSGMILSEMGIDATGLSTDIQFQSDRNLFNQTEITFGPSASNELMRDSIPAYYWNIHWKKERLLSFTFGSDNGAMKQTEDVGSSFPRDITFHFDTRGRILKFTRKVPDSTRIPSLSRQQAVALASSFLEHYTSVAGITGDTGAITSEKKIELPFRTDYVFTWVAPSSVLRTPSKSIVTVSGNIVSKFETVAEGSEKFSNNDADVALGIVVAILYIAIGIGMVIIAFRRFRSYEIGFRLAVIVGVTVGLLSDIEIFLSFQNEMSWGMLIPLIIAPLFTGGALVLVWAVCETLVRESWREKFISFDLLVKGHFFHSRVGSNVVRGIALGLGAFAVWVTLTFVGSHATKLWFANSGDNPVHTFDLSSPWLYILGHGVYATAYIYTFGLLFVVSFLRKYVQSNVLLVALGSVVLGVMSPIHLHPFYVGLFVSILASAIPVWAFYRYDAFGAFVTMVTFSVAQETAALFVANNHTYFISGVIVVTIAFIAVCASIATAYRKHEITDFEEITPAFERHITERQRLQQELEIARNVQMSFLPKQNPVTSTLDIAARCAPALEVGGDYYDFINLGNQRVGVAIGDVSGKGTQAAFFMTLTK
jgi:sigma-B regulation protein RsbU (phosphoserine phosphatase)